MYVLLDYYLLSFNLTALYVLPFVFSLVLRGAFTTPLFLVMLTDLLERIRHVLTCPVFQFQITVD